MRAAEGEGCLSGRGGGSTTRHALRTLAGAADMFSLFVCIIVVFIIVDWLPKGCGEQMVGPAHGEQATAPKVTVSTGIQHTSCLTQARARGVVTRVQLPCAT